MALPLKGGAGHNRGQKPLSRAGCLSELNAVTHYVSHICMRVLVICNNCPSAEAAHGLFNPIILASVVKIAI